MPLKGAIQRGKRVIETGVSRTVLIRIRNSQLKLKFICEHQQKSATIWKCGRFKWVLKLQKYSCLDSSMVEHLLVIDIIACHFYLLLNTNHYMTIWDGWACMFNDVNPRQILYIYYYTFEFQGILCNICNRELTVSLDNVSSILEQ
jgi:hypothetical protein